MLDTGFHQAAGLSSFTPQAQLRVLAVASQERASSGLENCTRRPSSVISPSSG